ncbi:F0F1 ATP synthase subunit A [bacterium]|jgi:F-type H+-transporting ATPase subunit a|nr:F0F1 ATP synthase subunit A [bacterium]MBT3850365.1 F0F1 ATP synthase subunit A [bacterium]MBT4435794.1 F0F1 ATP synthase subunit A [bacterium]MDG2445764.1 F0F1 ATP synthase subunit A [Thermodesulfobacteriota bacterium]|tara:strand:- start:333 stop:1034 length:702 start_codon:yes stop_codon:yes gene_type:complete
MSGTLKHAQWTELLGVNEFDHIVGSGIVILILILVSLKIKNQCSKTDSLVPSKKFSLTNLFEFLTLDFLLNLLTGIFGTEEKAKKYLPLLGGSFLFIFISNLLGIFPGFYPATQNLNSTLACSLVIFVAYNYLGFKEHGVGYLKHFMGPVIYLAPLMIFIEVVSHLVRPASLSLRLFWNMFGDHLVLQIFSNLTPYIVPAIFIGLGVFVSFLQAFIFTILSSIYISLSTSHDH